MTDRWHNYFEDGAVCFRIGSIIERIPALRSPTAARCFLDAVDEYRRRYGVRLLAYVIMPDHVHMLLWAELGETVEKFDASGPDGPPSGGPGQAQSDLSGLAFRPERTAAIGSTGAG